MLGKLEEKLKLDAAIRHFLDYQRTRKSRTVATINTYRSALGMFRSFVGDIEVGELTIGIIDQYAASLPRNFTDKTLRNRLTPIRSLLTFLDQKDISSVKAGKIDLPAVTEIEANFLDNGEQERLIAACQNLREKALVLCFLRSGLRVSELIAARTDDLYNRSLVVRKGKGNKPRVTFISEDADEAIKAYHATIPAQTYLFPSLTGRQVTRQYIHNTIKGCALRAKINKRVSCHTLRHTFATNLLMRGARVEDVQPMMGHTNIRTTMIYMHFTNDYLHSRYDEIMQKNPYSPTKALT